MTPTKNSKPEHNPPKANGTAGRNAQKSSSKSPVKQRVKKSRAALFITVLLLALVVSFLVAFLCLGEIGMSNFTDARSGLVSAFSPGKGYPVTINSADLLSADRIGNGLVLLEHDKVTVLDPSAKRTLVEQHTFADPVIETVNGRSLLFDRGAGQFRIQSRTRILHQGDAKLPILAATIGKNGSYAVATKAETATSEFSVYNSRKELVFQWQCAGERIAALALSNNGRLAAVVVIGTEQAELFSKIFVFRVDSAEPMASFAFPETVIARVCFGKSDTLLAFGDNLVSVMDIKAQSKRDTPFGADSLHRWSVHESGKAVVVLSVFGNTSRNRVLCLDAEGQSLFDINIDDEVRRVSCDKSYLCVLTAREVLRYNNKGELVGKSDAGDEDRRVVSAGRHCFIVRDREIHRESTIEQ